MHYITDTQKLQYYRGNYSKLTYCPFHVYEWCCCEVCYIIILLDDFKKMYMQKFKEMEKAYTKQVKSIKAMKAHGKSRVNAVSV